MRIGCLVTVKCCYMHGMLENVQRRFTWRLYGIKESNHDMRQAALRTSTRTRSYSKLSYTRRLKMLRLQTLEHRQFYHDVLLTCKCLRERIAVSHESLDFRLSNAPTRSGGLKLQRYRSKNKTTAASFLCRAPIEWGSLPNCIVKCRTISSFKTAFNNHFKCR